MTPLGRKHRAVTLSDQDWLLVERALAASADMASAAALVGEGFTDKILARCRGRLRVLMMSIQDQRRAEDARR